MTDTAAKPSVWKFQAQVIKALVLREMGSRYGHSRLGYLWSIIQMGLVIVGLLLLFTVRSRFAPPNLPLLVFLVTGYPIWFAFQGIWGDMTKGAASNSSLLMFPQITQLDLLIARVVLEFATQTVGMLVIVIGFMVIGGLELPSDPLAVAFCFWAALLLGIGVGLVAGSIRRVLPTFDEWTSPIRRLGGFFSGVLHTAAQMPPAYLPLMAWNPIFKLIEMARQSWHPTYQTPVWDPGYVVLCIIGLLAAGLVLERGTRRFIAP